MESKEKKNKKKDSPITLEELQLKIYHLPPSESPLFREASSSSSSRDPHQSLSFIPWTTTLLEDASTKYFPTDSYLDLRRQQNRAWAEDRLVKGNEQFYLDPAKADEFYQEGLDLIPDHMDLLVAQAKLWFQRRNRPHTAKAQLVDCLKRDPDHKGAKELLERFNRLDAARKGTVPKVMPQTRETSAFQDVLMERNLAMDMTLLDNDKGNDDKDDESQTSVQSSSRRHKESKTKKRKKKKKKSKSKKKSKHHKKHDKKKRRKRKRYDSSSVSDNDSPSSQESELYGSDEESRRGHSSTKKHDDQRQRQKRLRRSRHDSDLSSSGSSINGIAASSRTSLNGNKDVAETSS